MKINKILVPIDFSDCSDAALAMASSLAHDNNAKMLIVHVHERDIIYEGFGAAYAALPEERRSDLKLLLQSVKPTRDGLDVDRRLITGSPANAIVKLIEELGDVDLIVLGTHGRTGVSRLLMGSVAEAVVRKSPCPVLTIKEPATTTAAA